MALRTSLVFAGDASGAVAATRDAEQAIMQAAAAYDEADKVISRLAKAQATATKEMAAAKAAYNAGETGLVEYKRSLLETKSALSLVEAEHRKAMTELRTAGTVAGQVNASITAANDQMAAKAGVSTRQAAAGYQNLGRQAQDVAVQLQSGTNIGTIIGQQGPQVADALAQMGGRFGGLASFLAGPWGAAIILGVSALANMAQAFLTTGDAADDAKGKTFDFSKQLNVLTLDANSAAAAMEQLAQKMKDGLPEKGTFFGTASDTAEKAITDLQNQIAAKQRQITALQQRATATGAYALMPGVAVATGATIYQIGRAKTELADLTKALNSAKQAADAAGMGTLQRNVIHAMDGAAAATDRYTEALGKLNARREASAALDRTLAKAEPHYAAAVRLRDKEYLSGQDYTRELARIRAEKQAAEDAVRASQRQASAGSGARATADFPLPFPASSITSGFGPRTAPTRGASTFHPALDFGQPIGTAVHVPQVGTVEAVGFDRGLGKFVIIDHGGGTKTRYGHLSDNAMVVKGQSVQAGEVIGRVGSTGISTGAHLDYRVTVNGKPVDPRKGNFPIDAMKVAENGQRAREVIERQAAQSAEAMDRLLSQVERGADAAFYSALRVGDVYDRIGISVGQDLTAAMADLTAQSDKAALAFRAVQDETAATLDNLMGMVNAVDRLGGIGKALGNLGSLAVGMTNGDYRGVNGVAGSMLAMSPSLRGLGVEIGQQLDKVFGGTGAFAKTMTRVMEGAGLGVAGATMVFGQKGNNLGSAIGGVMGQSLGQSLGPVIGKAVGGGLGKALGGAAGPLGAIAGGILGSLVGGLFSSKPRGTATITSTTDKAQVIANRGEIASGLNQMSTGVQGALKQIADRLGADVGSFAVSIGQYKDYYQVSSVANDPYLGKSNYHKKSSNALYDGKDASAAVAAAIQNAIADGGVKGLSAAVEKALKSSPDIDVALAEALKVQSVELAIGGLGAQLEKQFKDFERQAADRLRIARQYGFDVVKMEERNAADRLALSKKLAADQIGSLQTLIDSMTSGSLFEGNAIDQRQAVLDQIAATRADANAGVEGAADKLAGLLEQLNNVSRDAYGTTGGFAADRATILDEARATIAAANQRVSDAAKASDPALTATNAALNENNDQNAAMLAALGMNNDLLQQLIAQGKVTDWSGLASAWTTA